MLKLQNETKCHNINFVTPEHVVPQVSAVRYHCGGSMELNARILLLAYVVYL